MTVTTEDRQKFGDVYVYCRQHRIPHRTGWCTASVRDKTPLNAKTYDDAIEECQMHGFRIMSGAGRRLK